jgi:phage gpG-like protein
MVSPLVDVDTNVKEFQKFFVDTVFDLWDDLRPVLKLISADFYKSEQIVFRATRSGPQGGFKDITESTKRQKKKKFGFEYPILVASGRLGKSMLGPSAPDAIHILKKQTLRIGTSVPYGIFHQTGTRRMPKRSFLFIEGKGPGFPQSKDFTNRVKRWNTIFFKYFQTNFKRKGLS